MQAPVELDDDVLLVVPVPPEPPLWLVVVDELVDIDVVVPLVLDDEELELDVVPPPAPPEDGRSNV